MCVCVAYRHKRSRKGWGMWLCGKVLVEQTRDPRLSGQVEERIDTSTMKARDGDLRLPRKTLVRPKPHSSAGCPVEQQLGSEASAYATELGVSESEGN